MRTISLKKDAAAPTQPPDTHTQLRKDLFTQMRVVSQREQAWNYSFNPWPYKFPSTPHPAIHPWSSKFPPPPNTAPGTRGLINIVMNTFHLIGH